MRDGPRGDAADGEASERDGGRAERVAPGVSPGLVPVALGALGEAELGRPDPQAEQDGRDRERSREHGESRAEQDEQQPGEETPMR